VIFDQVYKKQIAELVASGKSEDVAKKTPTIHFGRPRNATSMEANDVEVRRLEYGMDEWVYLRIWKNRMSEWGGVW